MLTNEKYHIYLLDFATRNKRYVIRNGSRKSFLYSEAVALVNKQNKNKVSIVLEKKEKFFFEKINLTVANETKINNNSATDKNERIKYLESRLLSLRDSLSKPNRSYKLLQGLQVQYRNELSSLKRI